MKRLLITLSIPAALILSVAPVSAAPTNCTYPQRIPVENPDGLLTLFLDPVCFRKYETGYRLDGNTLHFPMGGTHTISDASQIEAETLLRDAYGLIGDRAELVRTKF